MAVGFAIANEDDPVLDLYDAGIRDGDSEDVRGEVFQAWFTGAYGLGVDVPVDLPDLRGNLVEEAGLLHFIAELGFEDDGEGFDGEIEVDA